MHGKDEGKDNLFILDNVLMEINLQWLSPLGIIFVFLSSKAQTGDSSESKPVIKVASIQNLDRPPELYLINGKATPIFTHLVWWYSSCNPIEGESHAKKRYLPFTKNILYCDLVHPIIA